MTANKREAFPLIIKEFEDGGYDVKHTILNSAYLAPMYPGTVSRCVQETCEDNEKVLSKYVSAFPDGRN